MNIENPNPYGTVDVVQLEEFERKIGTRLPEDYRTFLLNSNGGKPQKRAFMAPEETLGEEGQYEWSERELVGFYGLHNQSVATERDNMEAFKLSEAWQDLQTDVPGNALLPIGQDWSGNYVCLHLDQERFGEVCFFDHDFEVETTLSKDFGTFAETLTQSREESD